MTTSPSDPAPAAADDPSAGSEQPVRRRFLGSRLRATLATAAAVCVLGVAAAPWMLSSPARVCGCVARLAPNLEADVLAGGVKLGWFGPIVLENLRVVPHDGSRPPLAIRRVEVSHGLAGMLLSLGDLGRVRVEGLEAHVEFDADRNSNLEKLVRNAADEAGAAAAPARPRRDRIRFDLEVVGAVVRLAGPWSTEPWVSDPLHVRATLALAEHGRWSEWTIEPVQLLADARLEPAVAQGVLAYITPILADATRTEGRFSVRLDGATLPVGDPGSGRLSGSLTMHAVDLGPGPLAVSVIRALPLNLTAPPTLRIAEQSHIEFRLADRKVWHKGLEFGVPLGKSGQRLDLRSSGSVGLDDKSLDLKLELPVPADLPQDRPLLASLAGRTLSLRIGGGLGAPRVNVDGSLRANAAGVVVDLIDRLRSGAGHPAPEPQEGAPAEDRPPPDRKAGPFPPTEAGGGRDSEAGQAPAATDADGPAVGEQAIGEKAGAAGTDTQAADHDAGVPSNATADALIDLVGGLIGEVAKRRAERRAAEAANPAQPPRRSRFSRRAPHPPEPVAEPASPAANQPQGPALEPVPQPSPP